jgi:3-deoxy-7-phosphoheptulonate synthase
MQIVVMKRESSVKEVSAVLKMVEELGFRPHLSRSEDRTLIGIVGRDDPLPADRISAMTSVDEVISVLKPFKLASREFRPEPTVIRVEGVEVGGPKVVLMAGPCAVESREQILQAAELVAETKGDILRGGAFKPRTSPYSFQGLGVAGLELLAEARERTGLPVVTEVLSPSDVAVVSRYADILQIGARNMQNYTLLEEVGRSERPVLLKRGMMSTVDELLMSAEYVMAQGNSQIILCERGIRTFETHTRYTLDISAVPVLKRLSHLPVIVDPSHSTGQRDLVPAVARAAVAGGADGILVEVHPSPEEALCDGQQSLTPDLFRELVRDLDRVAEAVGRTLQRGSAGTSSVRDA